MTAVNRVAMGKKAIVVLVVSWALVSLHLAEAQETKKVPRVGSLLAGSRSAARENVEGFRRGLRDLGYIEGKNILVEYRYGEGNTERFPSLVAELVQLKVDVLVTGSLTVIRAAKQATETISIVMVILDDPVATGIVESLAHPGGNVSGLSILSRELSGKRLELLKEVVPRMSRVGVLRDANNPGGAIGFKEYESAARALKIPLQSLEVRSPNPDFEGAFQAAAKGHANALITIRSGITSVYRKQIADLAIKNRLASMYEASDDVGAGGLMSYSANYAESFYRAATYVDKILKGTKPADLPVEQPTKFEFVINLKAAKQIGLTIPQSVLYRADKVIK
jgi:putative ABC transport system substrate-binding protein